MIGPSDRPVPREMGGLLPGPEPPGEEAGSARGWRPTPRGKSTAAEGLRFYCDVHRREDNESGYRITYTVDGKNFKHTDDPAEILAKPGDQIFVDVIPVVHTNAFIELLKRDVEVYYLRRVRMVKEVREKLGMSKSAKNDIKAMMTIDDRWFQKVDENYLVIRRMASTLRCLMRTLQDYENRLQSISDDEREDLEDLIKTTKKKIERQAKRIVEEARKRYPVYDEVVEELGITDENHLMGREALAELMPYIGRFTSYHKLRRFLGLFNGSKGVNKFYSKTARTALSRLTSAVLGKTEHTAKDEERLLKRIWTIAKWPRERLRVPA
ncbi:MAG: hypothetical protein QW410_06090 [Nitrososphaerota archaeon]